MSSCTCRPILSVWFADVLNFCPAARLFHLYKLGLNWDFLVAPRQGLTSSAAQLGWTLLCLLCHTTGQYVMSCPQLYPAIKLLHEIWCLLSKLCCKAFYMNLKATLVDKLIGRRACTPLRFLWLSHLFHICLWQLAKGFDSMIPNCFDFSVIWFDFWWLKVWWFFLIDPGACHWPSRTSHS